MKELSLEEIRQSELESLKVLRDYCERHGLRYYLTFGTLLGAVRHKGFIPWDDDIDVLMPRDDYDYLIAHFNEEAVNNREVISKEINPDFYLDLAKIIDTNTVLTEKGQSLQIGVWIDIFPLEYVIEDKRKRRRINKRLVRLFWLIACAKVSYRKERGWCKNAIIKLYQFAGPSKEWLAKRQGKVRDKIRADGKTMLYGILCRPSRPRAFFIPVDMFEPAVEVVFEGEAYCAPNQFDKFLRRCYGDYMKLPPPERHFSSHTYTCYWKSALQ